MNDSSEVKLHFLDYWRIIKARSGLIALAFMLIMITAGVTTYFLPREYFSKVKMVVRPDNSGPMQDVFGRPMAGGNDPMFIPTQFQILQTTSILYPVINQLKLVEKWSPPGRQLPLQVVHAKLIRMLNMREVRNTGVIEVGVYSTDPQEAANIANTIAVEYANARRTDVKDSVTTGLAQLEEEVEKQRERVQELAVVVTRILNEQGIVDPDPESITALLGMPDRQILALEQQLNQQRLDVAKIRGDLEQIEKLQPEELKLALRTLQQEDQTSMAMIARLQEANSEEKRLTSLGLGDNHPRIVGFRQQREYYSSELEKQLRGVRDNLATKLSINQQILDDLEARYKSAQELQIREKQKNSEYISAKTRYLTEKRIFEAAQLKYSTELLQQGIDQNPVRIWEKAEPSMFPSKPKVAAYMALATILGLLVGLGLAFFIEYLDTSVKTLEDVEKFLEIPVLAVIAKGVTELIKAKGDTPDAEAYRILRANVEFNKPDRNANTYTLVSGGPGEGKSTTLNNLAFTCAQGGYNVLVVDADLRRPSQHKFFEVDNSFGLTDYLTGKAGIDEITRTTKIDNLSFIPSGLLPGDAVGILNSQRMVELIGKLKRQYDLVFFDAPPILGVSDGSVLASEVDITIMVVQHRRFPRAMLQRVKQAVIHAGGTLIGVVLNNVDAKHDEAYSYYNSYNDYYATPERTAPAEDPAAVGVGNGAGPARPRGQREEY